VTVLGGRVSAREETVTPTTHVQCLENAVSEVPEEAVIAVFDDATQAEQAAHDLIGWDKANDDIRLGAIGLLTRKSGEWGAAEVETRNFSSRNTGKGAKVGMGLGVLAAALSGGLTLIPTAIAGAIGGGAVGSLSHKGLGVSDEELQLLAKDLDGGRAALLVMCDEGEVSATTEYLRAAGGRPQSHPINAADLQAAAEHAGDPQ
jgi:uncharacterized membrane protein